MTRENSAAVSAIEANSAAEVSQLASLETSQTGIAIVRNGRTRMPTNAPVTAGQGEQVSKPESRAALMTLLDRTPGPVGRDEAGQAPSLAAMFGAPADARETAQEADPAAPVGPEAIPAAVSLASLVAQSATSESDAHAGDGDSGAGT